MTTTKKNKLSEDEEEITATVMIRIMIIDNCIGWVGGGGGGVGGGGTCELSPTRDKHPAMAYAWSTVSLRGCAH